jgi:hypothetical protein
MIVEKVKDQLKINSSINTPLYIYLKDGTIVNSLLDIPDSERTLIFSFSSNFRGVDKFSSSKKKIHNFQNIL